MKSSTGTLLGLWSRGPPCNFTGQLLFLLNWKWLLHLINTWDQKIWLVKNQIITHQISEEKLKQLGLWGYCFAFSDDWSVSHVASSKSQTHYGITLKFSAIRLKKRNTDQNGVWYFVICRSLGIKHSFKKWLDRRNRFADFSKTVEK